MFGPSAYSHIRLQEQYMPSHTVTCIQCLTLASVSSLKLLDHAGVRDNTCSGINGARNCYSAFSWQAVVTARHVILYMIMASACERFLQEPGLRNLCRLHVLAQPCRSKSRNVHCGTKGEPWDVLECDSQSEL